MIKKSAKRILGILLCTTLVCSLAGCKGKGGNGGLGSLLGGGGKNEFAEANPETSVNAVFKETGKLDIEGNNWYGNLIYANGKVVTYSVEYPSYPDDYYGEDVVYSEYNGIIGSAVPETDIDVIEEPAKDAEGDVSEGEISEGDPLAEGEGTEPAEQYYITVNVAVIEPDGSNYEIVKIELPDNYNISNALIDKDGNIVLGKSYGQDTPEGNWENINVIAKYDMNGNLLSETEIDTGNTEYFYINGMVILNDGSVVIASDKLIISYDSNLNVKSKIEVPADRYLSTLAATPKGEIIVSSYGDDYGTPDINRVDFSTNSLGEKITLPNGWGWFESGSVYDLYRTDSKSLLGINLGDTEPVEVLNFYDSDINPNTIGTVCATSETTVMAFIYDENYNYNGISVFTKVDPKDVVQKEIITLGCVYPDSNISKRIISFNKSNDNYRIRLVDYDQYNTNEDYSLGVKQLDKDIVSGNAPDIIALDYSMNPEKYMSKGLFEPLEKLLEDDPELNKDDFLSNVLEAGSYDGKLYTITPSFSTQSFAMKKSLIGDETLTIEKMMEIENSTGGKFFQDATSSDVLHSILQSTYDNYIDLSTGKCSFDNEEFAKLLDYAKQYPEEIDWANYEYDGMDYYAKYRSEKLLGAYLYISSFRDYNYTRNAYFDEDMTITGFPHTTGTGACLYTGSSVGITKNCKYEDAAWEFIRYYLTDEYQDSIQYDMPIKKSAIQKKAEIDMDRPFWEDENGNKEYYDETYYIGEEEFKIDPIEQSEVDELMKYIESIDKFSFSDQGILDIIDEEAKGFFAGQKTAQDVAKVIQSRVQLYVNENS